jgi:methylthioribose-1-phosphate isomerase
LDGPIRFDGRVLWLLDQRALPHRVIWLPCRSSTEVADAVGSLVVRGAPAIGLAVAYGLAVAVAAGEDLDAAAGRLVAARPTAVNARWAVHRLRSAPPEEWADRARALHADDVAANQAIGEAGAALLPVGARVLTHCNAGALATGGWGTALGVVRSAHRLGRLARVYAGETRPWLQGARLTAWELAQDGIPVVLLCDGAAASLMAARDVDAVVVGADRVASNGDTANKVGTLPLAIAARQFGVPFYVAVPTSTLDAATPDGAAIPIEVRGDEEVRGFGGNVWAADVPVYNPVFDVTPAELVTAWITEAGLWRP